MYLKFNESELVFFPASASSGLWLCWDSLADQPGAQPFPRGGRRGVHQAEGRQADTLPGSQRNQVLRLVGTTLRTPLKRIER